MKTFHFLFHLELDIIIYWKIDNLLKTLKILCMNVIEGKSLGKNIAKWLLQSNNNDKFNSFSVKILILK